jgi:hypothetical protein
LTGEAENELREIQDDHVFKLEMLIDGEPVENFEMTTHYRARKFEVAWKYQMPEGNHKVKIRILNPKEGYMVRVDDLIIYGPEMIENAWKTGNH